MKKVVLSIILMLTFVALIGALNCSFAATGPFKWNDDMCAYPTGHEAVIKWKDYKYHVYVCRYCGVESNEKFEHNPGTVYITSADMHARKCTECDGYAEYAKQHEWNYTYNDEESHIAICQQCKKKKTESHTTVFEYYSDGETKHYKSEKCSVCKSIINETLEPHTAQMNSRTGKRLFYQAKGPEASEQDATLSYHFAYCEFCHQFYSVTNHNWADDPKDASKDYCTLCGATRASVDDDSDILSHDETGGHGRSNNRDFDENSHWYKCKVESCKYRYYETPHELAYKYQQLSESSGQYDYKNKHIQIEYCKKCSYVNSKTTKEYHNFVNGTCSNCQFFLEGHNGAGNHTNLSTIWANILEGDTYYHYHVCYGCNRQGQVDRGKCVYGEKTDWLSMADRHGYMTSCTICGHKVNIIEDHSFDSNGKCECGRTKDNSLTGKPEHLNDGKTHKPSGNYEVFFDEKTQKQYHYQRCSIPGCPYRWYTAECRADGYEVGTTTESTHTKYQKCWSCGHIINNSTISEKHTYGTDYKCTFCGVECKHKNVDENGICKDCSFATKPNTPASVDNPNGGDQVQQPNNTENEHTKDGQIHEKSTTMAQEYIAEKNKSYHWYKCTANSCNYKWDYAECTPSQDYICVEKRNGTPFVDTFHTITKECSVCGFLMREEFAFPHHDFRKDDYTCNYCGYTCQHNYKDENGVCRYCGCDTTKLNTPAPVDNPEGGNSVQQPALTTLVHNHPGVEGKADTSHWANAFKDSTANWETGYLRVLFQHYHECSVPGCLYMFDCTDCTPGSNWAYESLDSEGHAKYYMCTVCGYHATMEYLDHVFDDKGQCAMCTYTCDHPDKSKIVNGVCQICGVNVALLKIETKGNCKSGDNHDFGPYVSTDNYSHEMVCSKCKYKITKKHTFVEVKDTYNKEKNEVQVRCTDCDLKPYTRSTLKSLKFTTDKVIFRGDHQSQLNDFLKIDRDAFYRLKWSIGFRESYDIKLNTATGVVQVGYKDYPPVGFSVDVTVEDTITGLKDTVKLKWAAAKGNVENPENVETPLDVAEDSWYLTYVVEALRNGFFNGVGEGKFAPETYITRGMFVTALSRFDKADTANYDQPFSDVQTTEYYSQAIAWAFTEGIVNGMGDGTFAPDKTITREEMAVMMYNYIRIKCPVLLDDLSISGKLFSDDNQISDWAKEAVDTLVSLKVLSGRADGTFDPKANVTRAEAATILVKLYQASLAK